uniref:Myosin motor domain-containing protein n=1 Tax=Piliocolobus tephrosceles TaxID=591936 RepID=A0A8C9GDS7_9PRIM
MVLKGFIAINIDQIYTFTGPILIAINPFKTIKDLYSNNMLEKHVQPIKSKIPHIFATSNSAYLGMCNNNKSQTILISGESGAGKTESTKYVMKFLTLAGSDINQKSLIESQVLESNPLLEAFGNSRTLRNNNSSRFGKYIELQFFIDKKNYLKGKLCGAKILTYLLEKVRVCDQQEGERNYHIFYQICKAAEMVQMQNQKNGQQNLENDQQNLENGFQNLENGQQNLENGQQNLQNGQQNLENGLHNPENGPHNPENGQQNLENGLHNPENGLHNPENGQQNLENGLHNPENGLHNPENGLHNLESTPQNQSYYHFPQIDKYKNAENVKPLKINMTNFKSHVHFRYLTKSSVYELTDVDELEMFECTINAMQIIGIKENEINQILNILEGILYLGNIIFKTNDATEETFILESSYNDLKHAANFLDVHVEALKDCLCYKTIIANNEHYKKPINANIANDIKEALSRAIYGCLFLKIVESTNNSIGSIENSSLFCGVLDIFGFETFQTNSFEQLCINYTNECLQQFFNDFIFKCEERLYIEEGISWDALDFPDNKDCVDLLGNKMYGILNMLDDECQIPSGKDKSFCSKIITKHRENKRFDYIKTDSSCFIIIHFAGKVIYNSCGFLEKNKDQLSMDAQNVLLNSHNRYVASLFECFLRNHTDNNNTNNNNNNNVSDNVLRKKKFTTVASEFKEQLNLLMQRIKDTEPHFIRCIKPNIHNLPDIFDRQSVNEQLKYGGVLQVIKVSRAGYPVRLSHSDCVYNYKILLTKEEAKVFVEKYNDMLWSQKASYVLSMLYKREPIQMYIKSLRMLKKQREEMEKVYERHRHNGVTTTAAVTTAVATAFATANATATANANANANDADGTYYDTDQDDVIWSIGKSLCFFKMDAFNILSTLRSDFRYSQAVIIQKWYRGYKEKKRYKFILSKIIILQIWFKQKLLILKEKKRKKEQNARMTICLYIYGYIIRKKFLKKRKNAIIIQSYIRMYLAMKRFKEYKQNEYARKIQRMWLTKKEKCNYKKMKQITLQIERNWINIKAKNKIKKVKNEEIEIENLILQNQTLIKELNIEKHKKSELESKLVIASAQINTLMDRLEALEKVNKNNELVITELTSAPVAGRKMVKYTTRGTNTIPFYGYKSKDDTLGMHNDDYSITRTRTSTRTSTGTSIGTSKTTDINKNTNMTGQLHIEPFVNSKLTYEDTTDLTRQGTTSAIDTKTNPQEQNLIKKIKKLETENKSYLKENKTLNSHYHKLINLLLNYKDINSNSSLSNKIYETIYGKMNIAKRGFGCVC